MKPHPGVQAEVEVLEFDTSRHQKQPRGQREQMRVKQFYSNNNVRKSTMIQDHVIRCGAAIAVHLNALENKQTKKQELIN